MAQASQAACRFLPSLLRRARNQCRTSMMLLLSPRLPHEGMTWALQAAPPTQQPVMPIALFIGTGKGFSHHQVVTRDKET
ncbi:hypothetical protein E2562_015149 [Oryza meyeriana var. granulata]|uniref:Uncharacterized protein n=1 Tax=Oryza meyeriana var. granulata TaxID=110450 RepID=A0A6G1DY05_9ORYZ|nr:hypothetical protein E2562_015149 [Oryza meyeriana var. granulata]